MKRINKTFIGERKIFSSEQKKEISSIWKRYCDNTSIHGMKYLVEKNLNMYERIFWLGLLVTAITAVVYVSLQLSRRFNSSPLATVVASTMYPVSDVSYPAITICNQNRINFLRIPAAINTLLPNSTVETKQKVRMILSAINHLEFGGFEDLQPLLNYSFNNLESLNLTRLIELTMIRCTDLFLGNCWWRNKYFPCCDIFDLQKCEYGLCYSFNSATNDAGRFKVKKFKNYPWRTNRYGLWSGLRFQLNVTSMFNNPESTLPPGIMVNVHHPDQWPNNGYFIPRMSSASVMIRPQISYTTENVNKLAQSERFCFDEERDGKGDNSNTLPNSKYLYANCFSQCRQFYSVRYCNCSVDFFYPIGTYNACNISGLFCMKLYERSINYMKPPDGNIFFSGEDEGMKCTCLPECYRIDYGVEISALSLSGAPSDIINMDIHYQNGRIVVYRTDVTFTWLDLMVGFGGIAGLFLGSSLLSAVEFIYYLLLGFYENIRIPYKTLNSTTKIKRNLNASHPTTTNTSSTTIIIYPKDFIQLKIRN